MKTQPRLLFNLHWMTVILLAASAIFARQKEIDGLPLNTHMIVGFALTFVMVIRFAAHFASPNYNETNLVDRVLYAGLYIAVFFVLGMGAWVAYQRNLLGYLLDPVTAIGRGSFKLLADIHRFAWQLTFGWVLLHVGRIVFRRLKRVFRT